MLGTLATPTAIFHEFEFIGGVGFVLFGKIILSATDATEKGNQNTRCFLCFGHGIDYSRWWSKMVLARMLQKNWTPAAEGWI